MDSNAVSRAEAIQLIHRAWLSGRPLVPIYGAGISIAAGISSTNELIDYFARYKFLSETVIPAVKPRCSVLTRPRRRRTSRGLFVDGTWLDSFQMNEDLLILSEAASNAEAFRDLGYDSDNLLGKCVTDVKFQEQRRRISKWEETIRTLASASKAQFEDAVSKYPLEWHCFLHAVTHGHQDKIDSFFDNITRGREPAKAHIFNSLLSKLLGIRLTLTTNFDSLIERALADDSVSMKVYEIVCGGEESIPDTKLVASNRSLVKLHGGTHGLRANESLKDEFEPQVAETIASYVPDDALLFVVGYGGGDARVMALIDRILERTSADVAERLIWVSRSEPASPLREFLGRNGRRAPYTICRDGGLFLQQLFGQIAKSHPVRKVPYELLPNEPVWYRESTASVANTRRVALSPSDVAAHSNKPVIVFCSQCQGAGTSTHLARYVRKYSESKILIWIDLEEHSSVDSVLSIVYEEIRKYDAFLPSIYYSPTSVEDPSTNPKLRRVIQAIRRGNYLLAFDSVGEFCAEGLGSSAAMSGTRVKEYKKLVTLIQLFATRLRDLGGARSRLCFALSEPAAETAPGAADIKLDTVEFLYSCHELSDCIDVISVPKNHSSVPDLSEDGVKDALAFALGGKDPTAGAEALKRALEPKDGISLADRLIDSLLATDNNAAAVLKVASLFRRPRSRNDLYNVVVHVLGRNFPRNEYEGIVSRLHEGELLVEQEGGFLWMHRAVRGRLRDYWEKAGRGVACDAHRTIAKIYYEEAFLPSRDVAAFVEYMHHRALSAGDVPTSAGMCAIEALVETLVSSWEFLLSKGHAATLVGWISDLRGIVGEYSDFGARCLAVEGHLNELEAKVKRESADYIGCILVRLRQLTDADLLANTPPIMACVTAAHEMQKATSIQQVKSRMEKLGDKLSLLIELRFGVRSLIDRDPRFALDLGKILIDVAVCAKGIGLFDGAYRVALLADCLIGRAIKVLDNEPTSQRENGKVVVRLKELRIKCCFRLMDLDLWRTDPWSIAEGSALRKRRKQVSHLISRAVIRFGEGMSLIDQVPTLPRNSVARLRCCLYTLRARASSIEGMVSGMEAGDCANVGELFLSSMRFLKLAESALFRGGDLGNGSQRAVCEIHRAEGILMQLRLLRHCDNVLWMQQGRSLINRISGALSRAEEELVESKRNVWWWAMLFFLDAGLHYEYGRLAFKGQRTEARDVGLAKSHEAVFEALSSLSSGMDNYGLDPIRTQAALCSGQRVLELFKEIFENYQSSGDPNDAEAEWISMLQRAGLSWLHPAGWDPQGRLAYS